MVWKNNMRKIFLIIVLHICCVVNVVNAQNISKKCKTCNKTIAECRYGGEHPQCKTCKKIIDNCRYKGNHPKCKTCGKVIDFCSYSGKHPVDSAQVIIEETRGLNKKLRNMVQNSDAYIKSYSEVHVTILKIRNNIMKLMREENIEKHKIKDARKLADEMLRFSEYRKPSYYDLLLKYCNRLDNIINSITRK